VSHRAPWDLRAPERLFSRRPSGATLFDLRPGTATLAAMSTTSLGESTTTELDKLQLADWRRRVSELYSDARRLAVAPSAAHARWRADREAMYRTHPASPVPADRRADFRALHFDYDPSLRFELPLIPDDSGAADSHAAAPRAGDQASPLGLRLPVSTGQPLGFDRVGWIEIPFPSGPRRLALFWLPEYSGGLFLPFRDATNGRETYGGGRYLIDAAKGADLGGDPNLGTVVVDFNFAYQPSCAFDPRWSCPLSPPENRLDIEIRAGERIA
jgi:uncharacterized protein